MSQEEEEQYLEEMRQLKNQLPELVDDCNYTEPSEEHPFGIGRAQRMDPIDVTIEQVVCGQRVLEKKKKKAPQVKHLQAGPSSSSSTTLPMKLVIQKKQTTIKKSSLPRGSGSSSSLRNAPSTIKMKKMVKQIGNRYFCYTQNEKELYVLNKGNALSCIITKFDNLAIFNVPKEDRQTINTKLEQMAMNSGLTGAIKYFNLNDDDDDADPFAKTIFVKADKYTQYFDSERQKMNGPLATSMKAKICLRFMGLLKTDGQIQVMLRLYQVKLEENSETPTNLEPCMFA